MLWQARCLLLERVLSWPPQFVHKDRQPLTLPSKEWLFSHVPAATPASGEPKRGLAWGQDVSA